MEPTTSARNVADYYQQLLKETQPIFLFFHRPDCPTCEELLPAFKRVARDYTAVAKILIVNTAESPKLKDVARLPTLLVYRDAKLLEKQEGYTPPQNPEEPLQPFLENAMKQVFLQYLQEKGSTP